MQGLLKSCRVIFRPIPKIQIKGPVMKKNIIVVAILALGLVSIVNGEPKTRSSASRQK